MKRPQREDVISILAIAFGATLSFGITAAFSEDDREDAPIRVQVRSYQIPRTAPEPTMVIPDGYRALTVSTTDIMAIRGLIRPGSRVDVMETVDDVPADGEPTTRVMVRNVVVLGNDRTISRGQDGQSIQ